MTPSAYVADMMTCALANARTSRGLDLADPAAVREELRRQNFGEGAILAFTDRACRAAKPHPGVKLRLPAIVAILGQSRADLSCEASCAAVLVEHGIRPCHLDPETFPQGDLWPARNLADMARRSGRWRNRER